MGTLVAFHAHPDDESISTGGTIAKAASHGHRVVLVVATRGELGEEPADLGPDESLADRRTREATTAAGLLGVARIEFLGYRDSGMPGSPANEDERCFARADVDDAARRLARILQDEAADVLTVYDENGGSGHPDHIQVHRVGIRAAELAGIGVVYEATINRTHLQRLLAAARDADLDLPGTPDPAHVDGLGVSEERITTAVDVTDHLGVKRAAMAAHASQIAENSVFVGLPEDLFRVTWGTEWFIRRGLSPGAADDDFFAALGAAYRQ